MSRRSDTAAIDRLRSGAVTLSEPHAEPRETPAKLREPKMELWVGAKSWRWPESTDRRRRAERTRALASQRDGVLARADAVLPTHVARAVRTAVALSGELGVFTTDEALACGLSHEGLRGAMRAGILRRVEQGRYALPLVGLLAEEEHLLHVSALVRGREDIVVASHHSALVKLGISTFGADLGTVHLTYRTIGTYRRRQGRVAHAADLSTSKLAHGQHAVEPSFAVVQAGLLGGDLTTLVAGDSALRRGLTTPVRLAEAAEAYRHTAGIREVQQMLPHLDGKADSPPESLLRYAVTLLGFAPEPQYLVQVSNRMKYKTDLALPDLGLILEVDGRLKYQRHDGAENDKVVDAIVMEEKRRHSALERAGWTVLRFTWDDIVDAHGRLRLAEIERRINVALRGAR